MAQPAQLVFFDLETTSLDKDCDIIQIGAVTDGEEFNSFIVPEKRIDAESSTINGFTSDESGLKLYGCEVQACSIDQALSDFMTWLKKLQSPILIAHYGRWFDVPRLVFQLQLNGKLAEFQAITDRFGDTYPLFKAIFVNEVPNHKLQTLVRHFLDSDYVQSHTALDDSRCLQQLYQYSQSRNNARRIEEGDFSFSLITVLSDMA